MFAWILSPIGRWLSLAGTVVATLGVAWLKGRVAGKAAWEEKRRVTREKAMQVRGCENFACSGLLVETNFAEDKISSSRYFSIAPLRHQN